jgi:phage-related minor tail protein
MGSMKSIENITPSKEINHVLKNNDKLREKYYKIKIKRKSYKNRIRILEKQVAQLTNKLTELELQSRDHYKISQRGSSTSSYFNDRINILEEKMNNTIILEPQKNNLPFCVKKNKY